MMNITRSRFRIYLALTIVSAVVMVLSPFFGLVGTAGGMARSFQAMKGSWVSDPEVLSQHVGEVLISAATGLFVALLGLPVFITFLVLTIMERSRLKRTTAGPGADHATGGSSE